MVPILAEHYQAAAEALADTAVANHLPALLGGCNPGSLGEQTCAGRSSSRPFGPASSTAGR